MPALSVSRIRSKPLLLPVLALIAVLAAFGCSRDQSKTALAPGDDNALARDVAASVAAHMGSETPPANIATASFGSQSFHLWPYSGNSFAEVPSDPVNLLFVGKADPRAIRAALMALDGDRTAFGLPNEYPFNSTWTDADGDVQTSYGDGEGWVGNVIQLQLGRYEYGRAHLRLWRTGQAYGGDGVWTVGAAHFEILIPGTADHQVLSWEIAKQIVTVDMMRTGLLDAAVPMGETGVMSQTPTFRDIPPYIYNELPQAIRDMIAGPPVPVTEPVGILNSGKATIFNMAGAAPITPGTWTDNINLVYNQFAPKPFCNQSGSEWIHLDGPISIVKTVTVGDDLRLSYSSTLTGRLMVTPMDMTASPPVPSGAPYYANVSNVQSGALGADDANVMYLMKRLGVGDKGVLVLRSRLKVGTYGEDSYTGEERCLGPEENGP